MSYSEMFIRHLVVNPKVYKHNNVSMSVLSFIISMSMLINLLLT